MRPSAQSGVTPHYNASTIKDFKNQLDAICLAIKSRLKVVDG